MTAQKLDDLLLQVRACTICASDLPLGPKPIIQYSPKAPLLLIGQAPGIRVHESGIPWNDSSGKRLRNWLQLSEQVFYDDSKVAIMPMGFCYPGINLNGGDNPPRPECAKEWHSQILSTLLNVKFTLLIGQYANKFYLGNACKKTMTETVRCWQEYGPNYFPLPHPSWRNNAWINKNTWFSEFVLTAVRKRVNKLMY